MNKLLLTLLLATGTAHADEAKCLSKILFAEAESESISGVIAVAEATKTRAKRTGKSICKVKGVARKQPPQRLEHYWITLAKSALNDFKTPTVKNADSWNRGSVPGMPGKVTRKIGKHIFYVLAGDL